MSLSVNLRARINSTLSVAGDLSTVEDPLALVLDDVLASGTGLDQADLHWHDRRTIAAGANDDLDLAGVLTNLLGGAVNFARLKGIIVKLRTTTAGYTVKVGGATNPLSTIFDDAADELIVRGGGFAMLWAPDATAYAVTAGTGDILRIHNPNAGEVEVDVVLIGASA